METSKFELNIGVTPGYFHKNEGTGEQSVEALFQEIAEEVYKATNIAVAGIVTPAKTVYRTEYGCPPTGEDTFVITGLLNLTFIANHESPVAVDFEWRKAVTTIAEKLRKKLNQTTAYLSFSRVWFIYLKD